MSLKSFIEILKDKKQIEFIHKEVDPHLEIAEIQKNVQAKEGPALLFTNVKNSSFPVVTGLFGTMERVHLAFSQKPEDWIAGIVDFIHKGNLSLSSVWKHRNLFSPLFHIGKKRSWFKGALEQKFDQVDLEKLPLLQLWPEDGGHFMTLPLVYTKWKESENLGIYRMQRFDKTTTGLHFQIGKGGGFHYHAAERAGQPLPVTVYLGGPPELMLSAIAPLPENVSELLFASILLKKKLATRTLPNYPHQILTSPEFVLTGYAQPHERKEEGPFGDHYGYYSLKHPFPVFHCTNVYHRKGAIFPATVVGKPRQEDAFLGIYLQQLLKPLVKLTIPSIEDLWSYPDAGFHTLLGVVMKERYQKEALQTAFRILGEGQLSLTKLTFIIDQPVDLTDFSKTLTTLLERIEISSIYLLKSTSADTLDYAGGILNEGSKVIFFGLGEVKRKLPIQLPKLPSCVQKAAVFCPGCLVVQLDEKIEALSSIEGFPLVVIVDNVDKCCTNEFNFLWTVFTRFDPAQDLHLSSSFPIILDARMKSHYPKEVLSSPDIKQQVINDWNSYFETPLQRGDADQAHVY